MPLAGSSAGDTIPTEYRTIEIAVTELRQLIRHEPSELTAYRLAKAPVLVVPPQPVTESPE